MTRANANMIKSVLAIAIAAVVLLTSAKDAAHPDLIGYWNFDEADSDRVLDNSGAGHHGLLRGAVRSPHEKFGNVIECQRNALVEIPHTALLDQLQTGLTITAWVNRQTNSSWNTIVSREVKAGTSEYFGLAVVKNKALFSIDPDGAHYQNIKSETDVPVGEWIHLAGTYDNAEFKLYVNGHLIKSAPGAGPFVFQDQNPLLIGGNSNNQGKSWLDCFHGKIDEVHLFKRALSEPEIAALIKIPPQSGASKKLISTGPQNSNLVN